MSNLSNSNEIWLPIPNHPGYEASNTGLIRNSKRGNILKGLSNGTGYVQVYLNDKRYLVHRLIAETFIPNPDRKPYVDHLNTIRDDNRVENLQWVTRSENFNNPITRQNFKAYGLRMIGNTRAKKH